MDDDTVKREVELDAPVAEVWASLTEPERLSDWLGGTVELDVRPGGRGVVRRDDGAVRRVVVEAVEPGRRLTIRWWPFEEPKENRRPGPGTRVEFVVAPVGRATTLRVTEWGPWPLGPLPRATGEPADIGLPTEPRGPSSGLQAVSW